jgi:hypothetical protein
MGSRLVGVPICFAIPRVAFPLTERSCLACSTPRHMMLERGVQSHEAKNVTLEDEAVDMRVDSDRF